MVNIRSKGTRTDYEVVERFVELLHEGFDNGRDEDEEEEFEAIRKELGYMSYAAREIYDLQNQVKALQEKQTVCFWDAQEQKMYVRGEENDFIVERLARHVREKLDEDKKRDALNKAKLGFYNKKHWWSIFS